MAQPGTRRLAREGKAYGLAHRWLEDEDEEENFVPWMEVPAPITVRRLWTYLHEAVHMGSSIPSVLAGNNYSTSEAEAELGALRILEAEGLTLSPRAIRRRIEYEARKDRREFGAEYSPLVLECLAEFDRRIAALKGRVDYADYERVTKADIRFEISFSSF